MFSCIIKPEVLRKSFFGRGVITNKWIVLISNGSKIIVDFVDPSLCIASTHIEKGKAFIKLQFDSFELLTVDKKTIIKLIIDGRKDGV